MIIRRKPLGTGNIRQPHSLGLSLLRQGISRVQALTVRRSSEPEQTPDWGEGIPEDVFESIYGSDSSAPPVPAVTDDQSLSADQTPDQYDPGNVNYDADGFADSVTDAISRAEAPSPGSRPAKNAARRTVRRQPQVQAPAQVQRQPPSPPAASAPQVPALPQATPPAEITPAPRRETGRPLRRQSVSDGDTMPTDLQAMWELHKKLGHIRERPTGEAAQREALERANRPRRKAAVVEISPPKKGLPLDVPDPSIPSTTSPIGEPLQRKPDGSLPAGNKPAPVPRVSMPSSDSGEPIAYAPDYYGSDDDPADFTPIDNTFDSGDTSPEAEFVDDIIEDNTTYDAGATLVDFASASNEVRRTPQGGPQNQAHSAPRTEARDSHADQAGPAAVQRMPAGASREFAPSPSLENDPLADSDDEPGAASAAPAQVAPDTIQRSSAVQVAIARAESSSTTDDETDYYDPTSDEPGIDSGSSLISVPPTVAERTPNRQSVGPNGPQTPVQRSADPANNQTPNAKRSDSGPLPSAGDRAEQPVLDKPAVKAPPSLPLSRPVQRSVQRSEISAGDSEIEPEIAEDIFDAPPAASSSNVQRSAARAAAIARAEQPAPPETPDNPTAANVPQSPGANSPRDPIQRTSASESPGANSPRDPIQRTSASDPASIDAPLPRRVQRTVANFDPDKFSQLDDVDVTDNISDSDYVSDAQTMPDIPQSAASRVQRSTASEPSSTPVVDDDLFSDVIPDNLSAPADRPTARPETTARTEQPVTPALPEQRSADAQTGLPSAAKSNTPSIQRNAEARPARTAESGQPLVQRSTADDSADDFSQVPPSAVDVARAAARAAAIARAERPADADLTNIVSDAPSSSTGSSVGGISRPSVQRTPSFTSDPPDNHDGAVAPDANWPGIDGADAYDAGPDQVADRSTDIMSARPASPVQRSPSATFDALEDKYGQDTDSADAYNASQDRTDDRPADTRSARPGSPVQRTPSATFDALDAYDAAMAMSPDSQDADSEDDYYTGPDQVADYSADTTPARPGNPLQRTASTPHTSSGEADAVDEASIGVAEAGEFRSTASVSDAIARAERPAASEPVNTAPGQPGVQRTAAPTNVDYDAASDAYAYDAEYDSAYGMADVTYDPVDDYPVDPGYQDSIDPGFSPQAPQSNALSSPAPSAVQRYSASDAAPEMADSSADDSSRPPALNWPKLRRKGQTSLPPPPTPQPAAESIQRSADAVDSDTDQTDSDVDDSYESGASPEEVGMLAMLGLPPTTRIARGTAHTAEAPPQVAQRAANQNAAQRAVAIDEMTVNSNLSDNSINNNNPNSMNSQTGGTDSTSGGPADEQQESITNADVEQVAQEVYRQLRNRLRMERERTRGSA